MKKLIILLGLLLFCFNAWSFDYAEKQDNGSMLFITKDVEEIEKYLGVNLQDYWVVARRADNSEVDTSNYLMLLYPDKQWEVITFTDEFTLIFISRKCEVGL